MKKILIALLIGVAACAPQRVAVNVPFDPQEAAFIRQPGNGVITGQVFMRQQGGGVVTCAGETIRLVPVTRYASARMMIFYGNTENGRRPLIGYGIPEDPVQEYTELTKVATCDAQGNFRFEGVPVGEYFVTGVVRWAAGSVPQGGSLMRRLRVAPNQSQSVLLSG